MKIRFMEVNGQVAVDDRHSFQEARTGMILETEGKPYIVLVGENSTARLIIESKNIFLGANSVMHVNHPHPSLMKGTAYDLKMIAGRIWAKFDKGDWELEDRNAVIGVRG